ASIATDDATILPHHANSARMVFSEKDRPKRSDLARRVPSCASRTLRRSRAMGAEPRGFLPVEPVEDAHAALRLKSLPNRCFGSLGIVIGRGTLGDDSSPAARVRLTCRAAASKVLSALSCGRRRGIDP